MSDQIPQKTRASQEVVKEAGSAAENVGTGLLEMARGLLAMRREKGVGREQGRDDATGVKGTIVEMFAGRFPVDRAMKQDRDPFEHVRIQQRQAMRDLERFYREAKRRDGLGSPMSVSEFAKGEKGIVERMGPNGRAVARQIRRDVDTKSLVRPSRDHVRAPGIAPNRNAALALSGLAKGPRIPAPMPIAALAKGMGGMSR